MYYTMPTSSVIIANILLFLLPLTAAATSPHDTCKLVKITVKRLPDLNIPRNGHSAYCLNNEITVFGGHTTNFVLTPTAEYYKDGAWHLMPMAYPHDNGLCTVLRSGRVLLAGGHSEPMGVGQSYPVEEYDPATHTFRGFCILNRKRTFASGIELDSGRVVVSGNWYAGDDIEMFDGDRSFFPVKDVTTGRAAPTLLRTADGNVLIIGNQGTTGDPICDDKVDRLKGDPIRVPLLKKWQPIVCLASFPNDLGLIGDTSQGDYTYLLAMQDWGDNDTTARKTIGRELAFTLVHDTVFSMLPTTCHVPTTGVSPTDTIEWYSPLIADRKARRGYVHGCDLQGRSYVLCVEYSKRPAPITLYYTNPLPDAGRPMMALTADGDLMLAGGHNYNKKLGGKLENDNFSPLSSVYLLHMGAQPAKEASDWRVDWRWAFLFLAVLAAITLFLLWRHLHKKKTKILTVHDPMDGSDASPEDSYEALMQGICELMDQQQLYLNSELKLNHVADALNTNRNLISSCINSQRACSFSQFIGTYRVNHAKMLMQTQKQLRISDIWMQSGFSTETSFFRTFKAVTGMTPNEWRTNNIS